MTTFKAGDRVGVLSYTHREFGIVKKVTPSGQTVLKDGSRFDSNGDEIGIKSSYRRRLTTADKLQQLIDDKLAAQEKQARVQAVVEYLKGRMSYDGRHHINDEQKAELLKLVEAI